jgi:RNA polymerase-interacting CarD/CdnL/TRCF family regulator
MGTMLAEWFQHNIGGSPLRVRQAVLQLRLVRAVVRAERQRGTPPQDLLDRAAQIVEQTAVAIEGETDTELADLLSTTREEVRGRAN